MPTTFDILLSLTLVLLAWRSLRTRDLFLGIVLYVMFGLFVAMSWLRLHAPDIALAEVAIGAGLTGALFLGTLGRMESGAREVLRGPSPKHRHSLLSTGILILCLILCLTVLQMPLPWSGLGGSVRDALDGAGAENPVTAVVLNFRGYDTLLEIAVLLLALLGAHAVHHSVGRQSESLRLPRDSVLVMFVRLVAPILILSAGYLVWVGDHGPGGAFQAGALLGGLGVVILLAGIPFPLSLRGWPVRLAAGLGLTVFLMTGIFSAASGQFLQYPRAATKPLLLLVELTCALSIGVILASLFAACACLLPPTGKEDP